MSAPHPLDPLSPSEISESSRLLKEQKPNEKGWIFNSIVLLEPPKAQLAPKLLGNEDLSGIPRKSLVLTIERGSGRVFKAVVNLTGGQVETFEEMEAGLQPTLSPEDCLESERIVRESVQVQKRCEQLGLLNMDLVTADPWSIGYNGEPEYEGKRLVQLFMYTRNFQGDNHYAHPLNFVVVVDLNSGKVVAIDDLPITNDFNPTTDQSKAKIPEPPSNYDPDLLPEDFFRRDVKPLEVVQPEGPSFTVNGNEILWQKFKIRFSFNYREGLVLHDVRYRDGPDSQRPLFYRASLSEMAVPYGDPRPPFHRKCAFDIGDYGLGFCANSLELGCDCLGTIKYFDGVLNTHDGEPWVIKNAVCLHEEDAGTLHKHTEYRTGKAVVTRSRRLVLSFIATVVNYEYAFYWSFYQDGTINFEVKATGELSTNLLAEGADPGGHGTVVFPRVNGQFHQHIFCARIDPMVDGLLNSVAVVDVKALGEGFGSESNPFGQGFTVEEKVLGTSTKAVSDVKSSTSRFWKILNPSSIHPYTNKPVAWKLVPSAGSFSGLLAGPSSFIRARAGFATHSVWVTQAKDEEMFAGGLFINQSKGNTDGLVKWTQRDDNIENQDIVLWHSFGVTHIPRVEDFPIMPVETTGFTLKPCNFFTGNPGLDVPPSGGTNKAAAAHSKSTLADKYLGKCHPTC